mgnify:CR=1 FL=1
MSKVGNKGLVRNEALTKRIVKSVKEGKPYSQIAKEEGIAASTVCRHFKTAQGVASSQYHASRKSKNCQMCGKFFKPLKKNSKVCPDKECKRLFTNWQADQYRIRDGKVTGEITRNCDFCGKTYTSGGSRPWGSSQDEDKRYRPKYCSNACAKKRQHQAKLDKYIKEPLVKDNCVVCGTEFTTNKPNSKRRKKTCSTKCANQVGRSRQQGTSFQRQTFVKQCVECGGPFEVYKYARANGEPSESGKPKQYCSRQCFNQNRYARKYVKEDAKRRKKYDVDNLTDGYVVEQIQKTFRRAGFPTPNKEQLMQFPHYIEARRNLLKLNRFRTDIVSSRK